jgi:hypothetical protein
MSERAIAQASTEMRCAFRRATGTTGAEYIGVLRMAVANVPMV